MDGTLRAVTAWPLEIRTDGSVSAGALLWRRQGRLMLTVVAKATFAMKHEATLEPISPAELARAEQQFDRNPTRSTEVAGDLAPFLRRCDVTFVGHAHAPGGRPAPAGAVRLAVFRDARALLDKTLHVFGDREARASAQPFTKLPIVYERALGGAGVAQNPVGVEAPNVVDPNDPSRPAGFAPISRYWPARKRLLGAISREVLEGPTAEVPEAVPWEYFQSAPADQRIDYLCGGEWIVLDGLHPTLPRVQTQVPRARALACVRSRSRGDEVPIEMVADTLAIDGDRMVCSIVWRGRHEIGGGDAAVGDLSVAVGLELPGRGVAWSAMSVAGDRPVAPAAAHLHAGEGTIALHGDAPLAAAKPTAPFPLAAAGAASPSASATPWGGAPLRQAPRPVAGEGTVAVSSWDPGGRPPESSRDPEATLALRGEPEATLALRGEEHGAVAERPLAPFPLDAGLAPSSSSVASTPWGGAPLKVPPAPVAGEGTLALGGPPPIPPPAPVARAPIAPAPAAPASARASPPPAAAEPSPPSVPPAAPPQPGSPPKPRDAASLAAKLLGAGASSNDVAALLGALRPPPPPPDDDDGR